MSENMNQNSNQNPYGNNPYASNPYQSQSNTDTYQANMDQTNLYQPYPNTYADQNVFQTVKQVACEEVVAKSFLFMVAALFITAFAAFTVTPEMSYRMLISNTYYLIIFAELAIVLASNVAIRKNHTIVATILFTIYSYLTGATLSFILSMFTTTSLVATFVCTASVFGIMAVYGMATKKDLSKAGNILLMGLIGIIIVSTVNIVFLHSDMFDLGISIVAILIFVGLTAYDTQKIKKMVAASNSTNVNSLALFGAFELYLDFINLFLRLLRILGKRK